MNVSLTPKTGGSKPAVTRSRAGRSVASPRAAFTLVELIIGMLIFTVFIGVVSTTYIFVSRSMRHAAEVREVYAEARFLMDRLTEEARLMTIDYDCFVDAQDGDPTDHGTALYDECNITAPSNSNLGLTDVLPLISADGTERIVYRFDDGELSVLELEWDEDQGDWVAAEGYYPGFQSFEMDSVELEYVQFMVKPLLSPYDADHYLDGASQYQPSVNVVIAARSTSTLIDEVVNVRLQSTISSRVYGVNF